MLSANQYLDDKIYDLSVLLFFHILLPIFSHKHDILHFASIYILKITLKISTFYVLKYSS